MNIENMTEEEKTDYKWFTEELNSNPKHRSLAIDYVALSQMNEEEGKSYILELNRKRELAKELDLKYNKD